ncbi:MAG TPA: pyridoxal-phosphate dependent enzyme, partial [Ktedonobacteraceae bacterium]|nr:pyridoxal-phosphate dependent enzyme [Ktedonobacteraceae bacterium]
MNHIKDLQCVLCGASYSPAEVTYSCPACGPLGVLEVHYDYEQVAQHISRAGLATNRDTTMWRYRALLPISYSHKSTPPLAIGGTPLYPVERLRARLGMAHLWLKDDSRNPSASLKDRASIIAVTRAEGKTVACASTGNAASSLAVQAAAQGLECYIFVPYNAPRA